MAELGGRFLVLIDDTYSDLFNGRPTRPSRLGGDGWKRLIDATHRAADDHHHVVRVIRLLEPDCPRRCVLGCATEHP